MPRAAELPSSRDPFLRALPVRSRWLFCTAVFLMFAPIMPLVVAQFAREGQSLIFIAWLVASGVGGVLWLASFTFSLRLLWITVPYQLALSTLFAFQANDIVGFALGQAHWHGGLVIALLAGGYVCFVLFVIGEGARAYRMRVELGLAQRMHASLAPEIARRLGPYEIRAVSHPSGDMGGDLVDVVETSDASIAALADVSGHGVRAGVVMAMLKSALHARAEDSDLKTIVRSIDRTLHATTETSMFATGCVIALGEDGRCEAALAGHLPLYVLRRAGTTDTVMNEALPLGVVEDQEPVVSALSLDVGDRLVVYTDGLTESQDADGRELGVDGALSCLESCRDALLDELIDSLLSHVDRHGSAGDDRSVLVVERVA